jgi:hypothetical protein
LKVVEIDFVLDLSNKGAFFFLDGTGQIYIENCVIHGVNSIFSFIIGISGDIFIISSSFLNCSLRWDVGVGSLPLSGSGSLISINNLKSLTISNCLCISCNTTIQKAIFIDDESISSKSSYSFLLKNTNISCGNCILKENVIKLNSILATAYFKKTIFSNVSLEENNRIVGGVIYVKKINRITFKNCVFENVGNSFVGGGIVLESCGSVFLFEVNFTNCTSSQNGGAIQFRLGSRLNLSHCTFCNCSSINGNGGAISTSSNHTILPKILFCTFINNTVRENKSGSDIFDNSDNHEMISPSYYTHSSVFESYSSSSGKIFCVELKNEKIIRFDCLLAKNCFSDSKLLISVDGVDINICGNIIQPCESFSYSYDLSNNYKHIICYLPGNYSFTPFSFSHEINGIEGVLDGNKLKLSTLLCSFLDSSKLITSVNDVEISLKMFNIIICSDSKVNYFYFNKQYSNLLILGNISLTCADNFYGCIFCFYSGEIKIENCEFWGINFSYIEYKSSVSLFYFSFYDLRGGDLNISNTFFHELRSDYCESVILNSYQNSNNLRNNIENCTFSDVSFSNPYSSSIIRGSLFSLNHYVQSSFQLALFNFRNNIIDCVVGTKFQRGGAFYFIGKITSIDISNCSFMNVSCGGNGSVICSFLESMKVDSIINSCLFENCKTYNGGCGTIYIYSVQFAYYECEFRNNTAVGSSDIYDRSSGSEFYTEKSVFHCCSTSKYPRIIVYNNGEIVHYSGLLGSFCDKIIYYVDEKKGDLNGCGSQTNPCYSISKILDDINEIYYSVCILSNTYKINKKIEISNKKIHVFGNNNNDDDNLEQAKFNSVRLSFSINSNGLLDVSLLNFIYDNTLQEIPIYLNYSRAFLIDTVISNQNKETSFSLVSFIVLLNGSFVNLMNVNFHNIQTKKSLINFKGVVSLIFNKCFCMNSTFSSSSSFLQGLDNNNIISIEIEYSNFSLLNTTSNFGGIFSLMGSLSLMMKNVFVSDIVVFCEPGKNVVNGGILFIDGNNSSYVIMDKVLATEVSEFSDKDSSINGGLLWVRECDNITIKNCKFVNITISGSGGCFYFGSSTHFIITNSKFNNCSSGNYGGAIFSDSKISQERILNYCIFSSNAGKDLNSGNDIFDNSSIGYSLYSSRTVNNCSSNSSSSKFVVVIKGIKEEYDCLFSGIEDGCKNDCVFVDSDNSIGFDYFLCGTTHSNPCLSITKASEIVSGNFGVIKVNPGTYVNTVVKISQSNVSFLSFIDPKISNSEKKCVLFFNPSSQLFFESMVTIGDKGNGTFRDFIFLFSFLPGAFHSLKIFLTSSESSLLSIENCKFNEQCGKGNCGINLILFENAGNRMLVTNSSFSEISLLSSPLFIINSSSLIIMINVTNCSFIKVKSECESPCIIGSVSEVEYDVDIEFTNLFDIGNINKFDKNGGLFYLRGRKKSKLIFNENRIYNISVNNNVNGGVMCISEIVHSFVVENCNFKNISDAEKGGCVYFGVESNENSDFCSVKNCSFLGCNSMYGGAFYIDCVVINFLKVHFSENIGYIFIYFYLFIK